MVIGSTCGNKTDWTIFQRGFCRLPYTPGNKVKQIFEDAGVASSVDRCANQKGITANDQL